MLVSPLVVDLIDRSRGRTAAEVGSSFFAALQPLGAKAIYARARTGAGDEHVYSRISPAGWEDLYADRKFEDCNFLTREYARRTEAFAWSDIDIISPRERVLVEALTDYGVPDGLAMPCHGRAGYNGVVSLAFERLRSLAPSERAAITIAGLVVHERMHNLSPPVRPEAPKLTPRERDCLAFIADGLSDGEIASQLGVSVTTITSHVQNARRKLGARTRAQAVAKLFLDGIF